MNTWLKLVGSQAHPITEAPWHGIYMSPLIGFRKENKPGIQIGDHLFLYAPGGSLRIFALAETVSDPEHDPNYNPEDPESCRWRIYVRYIRNMPVTSGILLDVINVKRRLESSVQQKSHVRLEEEESTLAYKNLPEIKIL